MYNSTGTTGSSGGSVYKNQDQLLVGVNSFGCLDIDIECKNISISAKQSESGILKTFCCSISLTTNRKRNLSNQNIAALIKNALKTSKM